MKLPVIWHHAGLGATCRPRLQVKTTITRVSHRYIHNEGPTLLSRFWAPTGGIAIEDSSSGKESTHALLHRAGFLRQSHTGLFQLLPLGLRVQSKISRLLDAHMLSLNASKLSLSTLTSTALWQRSGRLASAQSELFHLTDRKSASYLLAPTHEEEITALVAATVNSHRDLPLRLYQISRKYRDEMRPRGGLLRAREFLMKDLYTFDLDPAAALETYAAVRAAYGAFFKDLRLPVVAAAADSGAIGGDLSHEYHLPSALGEDTVLQCRQCGWAGNEEVLASSTSTPAPSTSASASASNPSAVPPTAPSLTTDSNSTVSCPTCSSPLTPTRAIELGHTFHLGTKYTAPLGALVKPPGASAPVPLQMGCHGIGVSRLIAAAAAHFSTPKGLDWPWSIAPFEVAFLPGRAEDVDAARGMAEGLVGRGRSGEQGGVGRGDVLVDDRADRDLGWKMKDADLVGHPVVVVLGRAWRKDGRVEVQCRRLGVREDVEVRELGKVVARCAREL